MKTKNQLIEEAVERFRKKWHTEDVSDVQGLDDTNSWIKDFLRDELRTIVSKSGEVENNRCVQLVHKIAVLGTADHTNREIKLIDSVIEAISQKE